MFYTLLTIITYIMVSETVMCKSLFAMDLQSGNYSYLFWYKSYYMIEVLTVKCCLATAIVVMNRIMILW